MKLLAIAIVNDVELFFMLVVNHIVPVHSAVVK